MAPIANAGDNLLVIWPDNEAYLDGRASKDSDGTIISYKWVRISGPSLCLIEDSTASATRVSELIEGTYVFELTVTDDKGSSSRARLQIRIQPDQNYKFDTTIIYQASNPHPDTSGFWLANIVTEWGSYQSFNISALGGVDTSNIKVFRQIGSPINYPWRELSYVTDFRVGVAVPLYGGVFTISGETISVGIGIIGSPVVTIYLRIMIKK